MFFYPPVVREQFFRQSVYVFSSESFAILLMKTFTFLSPFKWTIALVFVHASYCKTTLMTSKENSSTITNSEYRSWVVAHSYHG